MHKTLVRHIMIPLEQYPHVPASATLREAVVELQKCQITVKDRLSLPRTVLVLCHDNRELCGYIRRRDILRGLEPGFLCVQPLDYRRKLFDVQVDPNLAEITFERTARAFREQANRPVRDVMLPIKATIDYDDHVMKAVYEMVDLNVSFLPVLRSGDVVGVVRSVDVLNVIAQIIL